MDLFINQRSKNRIAQLLDAGLIENREGVPSWGYEINGNGIIIGASEVHGYDENQWYDLMTTIRKKMPEETPEQLEKRLRGLFPKYELSDAELDILKLYDGELLFEPSFGEVAEVTDAESFYQAVVDNVEWVDRHYTETKGRIADLLISYAKGNGIVE